MSSLVQTLPTARLFTVDEYYRMSDLGILSPEERTELIDGEVIAMAAQNPPHVTCTQLGFKYLTEQFEGKAFVRMQAPICLSKRSMPEPDIAVVHLPEEQYYTRHPKAKEVYLVIEVSDATLRYDIGRKAKLYARASIPSYWVIDVVKREIHAHLLPVNGEYQQITLFQESDSLMFPDFESLGIQFKRFFPPNS
ncbi:MAG: Uma2 family endonuclease [Chroococcidiopsidaceae cyanobacterium CP_BM_RX_35]|nr:Uma2 family endonuclease [Chroococcidiopsidaceae cyanobacterium CP_BM_RX_35]